MTSTRIYLGEDELKLLEHASRETGASRSELVRRAVRSTLGHGDGTRWLAFRHGEREEWLAALRASAGTWSGSGQTGAEYVDDLRGGDPDKRFGVG